MVFSYLYKVSNGHENPIEGNLHCEHNAAAQYQSRQSRNSPGPEREDTLIPEYSRGTNEAVPVLPPGFDRLHPSPESASSSLNSTT